MKLRTFFGSTSRSVPEQVRIELGPDATIVANPATADGIEASAVLPARALRLPKVDPACSGDAPDRRRAIAARASAGDRRDAVSACAGARRRQVSVDAMYAAAGTFDLDRRIAEHAPLVRRMAHHLAAKLPPSVEIDDIIQAGMIGLMHSAARYEENQGTQFETYASQRIRGAMLDELRQNDWLPRSMRKSLRRVEGAIARLEQKLGRAPTEGELAKELDISLAGYRALLQEARGYTLLHIDDFDAEDEEGFLERNVPDNRDSPFERVQDARFRAELVKAIDALPDREKLLLSLYYEQELNFKAIAEVLEVSESRICQLHGQAVARLRAWMRDW